MIGKMKEVSRKQETFQYTAIASLIVYLLLQYSWSSLLTFTLICTSVIQLLRIKIHKVQERGLISMLPRTLQVNLLDRSIFDLLCDIWYIPKISLYIKAFFKPFVQNISPEQAASALQELPDSAKRAIMTKGLINFLPNFMQSAIMPQQSQETDQNNQANYAKQRYINEDEDNEDQDSLGSTNTTKSTKFQTEDDLYDNQSNLHPNLDNDLFIAPHTPTHPLISSKHFQDNQYSNNDLFLSTNNLQSSFPRKQNQFQNNTIKEITIKDDLSNNYNNSSNNNSINNNNNERYHPSLKRINKNAQHEFSFNNNLFKLSQNEPNTFIKSQEKEKKGVRWSNQSLHQSTSSDDEHNLHSSTNNFYEIFHNRGILSDEEQFPKTKLIACSSIQLMSSCEDIPISSNEKQGSKPKLAVKWDNLELFRNSIKENYRKYLQMKPSQKQDQNSTSQHNNKANIFNSARSILNLFHSIMELKKMGNVSNMDNKKLLKVFLISSIFMGAQVMTSRRARRWMVHTSLMFLYIVSFLLTTGTLGIIALKYHQDQQHKSILNKKKSVIQSQSDKQKDQQKQKQQQS